MDIGRNIVYYDGSGGLNGSGSPATVQAIFGTGSDLTLYIQDNLGFQKSGYTFTGWKNSSGENYLPGRAINATADLTVTNLTAQWAQNHTLYFVGNGGLFSGMSISTAPTYNGKLQSLSINDLKWEDHEFLGWNTEEDGTGTSYSASDLITISGDFVSVCAMGGDGSVLLRAKRRSAGYGDVQCYSRAE